MVCLFALWAGHHDDGVAAEVFIEFAGRSASEHGLLVHGHRVVFVVETGVELVIVVSLVLLGCGVQGSYHGGGSFWI